MLPNYLRTYSSALCQIRALENAFKKKKNGQSVPKILVLNACIWLAKIHSKFTCNTLHILPVTMTCAMLCWQTYLGMHSLAFATFEPWRRHLRRVTSAKGSQKSEFHMLAFDWLECTDKNGCNIFPAWMTCAELWCRIVWEHFPQLCVNFQPWRRHLSNIFMTTPYF